MTAGDTDHPGGVITSFVLIDRGPPVLCCGLITLIWLKNFKKAPLPRVKILITSEGFPDFSHPCKPLPPNANNPSLARRLWGPWWKQEPSMWSLRISLFVVITVKSRRALVLVLPSTADPKSWSGAEGIQVITCSLSSQGVFCVRQVSHKRENLWDEGLQRTSFRNVEEHESAGLCLFYSFLEFFFPFLCMALKWNHRDLMIVNFQRSRRREVYNVVSMQRSLWRPPRLTGRPWTQQQYRCWGGVMERTMALWWYSFMVTGEEEKKRKLTALVALDHDVFDG